MPHYQWFMLVGGILIVIGALGTGNGGPAGPWFLHFGLAFFTAGLAAWFVIDELKNNKKEP